MGAWFEAHAARLDYTRFFAGDGLPDPAEPELVVVMGGPMSVNDEAHHPWLVAEKAFVRAVLERGTPLLGVCLGAQLMAAALGARVYPGPAREIGWFPVEGLAGTEDSFHFPPRIEVFHWHGETFDLPPGAVHLARSQACAQQAFQVGPRAIGLQFHLETTPETARLIIDHSRDELVDGPYIQDEQTMLRLAESRAPAVNRLLGQVLDYLVR